MRRAVLLFVLAGCEAVFPLVGPGRAPGDATGDAGAGIMIRSAFEHTTGSTSDFQFTPPAGATSDGDIVLLIIQSQSTFTNVITTDPSWTVLAEGDTTNCASSPFHVWFLRAVSSPVTQYSFHFSVSDSFVAAATAYANAGSAALVSVARPGTNSAPRTFSIPPPVGAAADSVIWFGGAAGSPWGAPPSNVRVEDTIQNLVVYAQPDPFSPVNVDIPIGFCLVMAELEIER